MVTETVVPQTTVQKNRHECVRALGRMIDKMAADNELATELSADVVRALDEAGIFSVAAPRELGGAELHPDELIDVISELSYWDGSAGWYAQAVITGGAVTGAYLGDSAVEQIFPGRKFTHVAGQVAPVGKAVRVEGGYRVSGDSYSFASGSPHAQWISSGYIIYEDGKPVTDANGKPLLLAGFVPRATVKFKGNWDVLGLRGTGSYDFEVTEQFLPEDFAFFLDAPLARRGGPLYRMGFLAVPCICHSSFAIGATRRIIDEWREFARKKKRVSGEAVNEIHTFQRDIAAATADLRAAEAYVRRSFSSLYAAAVTGTVSDEMKLEGRLCASHVFLVAMRTANAAFASCTTTALRNGCAIQRFFRDIHAGNAHYITSEQSLIEAGRVIAGIEGARIAF